MVRNLNLFIERCKLFSFASDLYNCIKRLKSIVEDSPLHGGLCHGYWFERSRVRFPVVYNLFEEANLRDTPKRKTIRAKVPYG